MMKKLIVSMAMLTVVLSVSAPAFARSEPIAAVEATGTLEELALIAQSDPPITHGIKDEASGAKYVLRSSAVDLDAYTGKRVTVYGTSESETTATAQYGANQSEDSFSGILDVDRIELARYTDDPTPCDKLLPNGDPNPDYDQSDLECLDPNETVTVTFELTIDGEVPEGRMLAVDTGLMDTAQPVFCSTTDSSLPRCEDGATYSDTFEASAGSLSYEYTVFDQNYGGIIETFAADTRTFTEDETVSATYKPGDPGNNVEIVEATGVLEEPEVTTYMYGTHAITDEASGEYYALESGIVDLYAFVGQSVTLYGSLVEGYENGRIEGGPPLVDVYQVEPASDPNSKTVTATFELTVEGEPPAGTEFFGQTSLDGGIDASGALLDQDGDGVYVTGLPVERGAEREARIDRADPSDPGDPYAPLVPSTIKDFGEVTFDEDETFSATISFEDDNDGSGGGSGNDGSGGGKFLSNAAGGIKGLLPSTGGGAVLAALGAGVLLVSGGLLLRKVS